MGVIVKLAVCIKEESDVQLGHIYRIVNYRKKDKTYKLKDRYGHVHQCHENALLILGKER